MTDFTALIYTTLAIGLGYTLFGVDHYLPIVALSQSNKWSNTKTFWVVIACGLGHVASSLIIGLAGIGLSAGLTSIMELEEFRGLMATWFLIVFGAVYFLWGIRLAVRHKEEGHSHGHHVPSKAANNAMWGLLAVFVLGPCEPFIPLIIFPAASMESWVLVVVTALFTVCTVAVMLAATFLALRGIRLIRSPWAGLYSHAIAGIILIACGLVMLFLE